VELKVGESTLQRRVVELTDYKTWTEFQRSLSVSQHAHETEKMQNKDKVVIITVNYVGIQKPFDLAEIEEQSRFQELQKLIEQSFNLQVGTYDIKWSVEGMDTLYITDYKNIKACFSLASKLQFNYIALRVENK